MAIAVFAGQWDAMATAGSSAMSPEARRRSDDAARKLQEVEKNRQQVHEQLQRARKQEQQALQQLNQIKNQLNQATGALVHSKHKLVTTERTINETERNLLRTHSEEEQITEEAARRLREIYMGQRLGFLEMLFQARSVQALIDLLYYQEKIAESDRRMLADLRARAMALEAKRNRLGDQKNLLGGMVSEFARKALQLNKEKSDQERVAERLRTQRAFYEQAERQLAQESLALERQIVDMEDANKGADNIAQGSGKMMMPLNAPVTSPFGWRRHPIFKVRKFHTGVDLAGPNRSEIKAADSGNVLYSGWYGGYGKVVIVSHGNGTSTLYAHLSKTAVDKGDNVSKGQVVGYEGSTGFSTGPHLHFEVRVSGKPQDPLAFVK